MRTGIYLGGDTLDSLFEKLKELDGFSPFDDKPVFRHIEVTKKKLVVTAKIECSFSRDTDDSILYTNIFRVDIDSYLEGKHIRTSYSKEYFNSLVSALEIHVDDYIMAQVRHGG